MASRVLTDQYAQTRPDCVTNSLHYEILTGSHAYGTSRPESDFDIYGFCIPPPDVVIPALAGEIDGFGTKSQRFHQWQLQHKETNTDITIYSIVKYFHLCMGCNPNMVDSLFVPEKCVLYESKVGKLVRENRHLFLSKKAWHTYKGYAYSQLKKIRTKNPVGKRKSIVEKYGYDVKFAYHLVRLMDEVEQILTEGTIHTERDSQRLNAVRNGEWELNRLEKWFVQQERLLEDAYLKSDLPYTPRENEIKELLIDCLEIAWNCEIKELGLDRRH